MTFLRRPEDVLKTSVSAGTHFTQPVVLKVSIYAKLSIIISKTLDTSNLNRLLILEIRIYWTQSKKPGFFGQKQPFTKLQNIWSTFIYSFFCTFNLSRVLIVLFLLFAHDHSIKTYGSLLFIFSSVFAPPFDLKLGSSLIYFLYLYKTIWPSLTLYFLRYFHGHMKSSPKKDVLKNLAIFTRKQLCWSLWRPATLLKETPTQVLSYEYSKIFKIAASFVEDLRWLLLKNFTYRLAIPADTDVFKTS